MTAADTLIDVEVAYAGLEGQFVLAARVPRNATVGDAIDASGLRVRVPGLIVSDDNVGVFAQRRMLSSPVEAGDRVEVYRPLIADPKDVRRARAARNPLKPRRG